MASTNTPLPQHEALLGANLRRLMAELDMTLVDVSESTGLDQRTLRGILRRRSRPHARTLFKLARGLGVSLDELFEQPGRGAKALGRLAFDRATNPATAEAVAAQPELFADWTVGDFDELFSRVGVGGELTVAGAVAAAKAMNRRREVLNRAAIVLETDHAELLEEFIDLLYRRATSIEGVPSEVPADDPSPRGRAECARLGA